MDPDISAQLVQSRVKDLQNNTDFANVLFDRLAGYAIVAADFDGNILAFNSGARIIYGYQPIDVIGTKTIETFFPPDMAEKSGLQGIIGQMRKKGSVSYEGEMLRRDGRTFPCKAVLALTKDKSEKEVGFVMIVEDLTDRTEWHRVTTALKEFNKQLIEMDRLKTEFLANVSHELRTPLTVIMSGANNLLSGTFGPMVERQKAWVGKIKSHGERLAKLINDILDLSKLESGKGTMSFETTDIEQSCRPLIDGLVTLAQQNQITLACELEPDLPKIWACALRLEQVLTNLIANAMKFTPAGGRITVTVKKTGERVEFKVSDTGPGIPPEFRDAIFDRFRQLGKKPGDNTRKGVGLGLAISREIVAQHKGKIWVEGQLGKGSDFIFSIPLDFRKLATDPNERNILIIDDDPQVCELMDFILSHKGYRTSVIHDGDEALARIQDKSRPLELVFLDLILPGMGGKELLNHIASLHPTAHVAIMSAYSTNDIKIDAMGSQITLLPKPIDIQRIDELVQRVFEASAAAS